MQISTDASQLASYLEIVEKALPVRSTMPVICNILMEVKENELIFSSTNLEMFLKIKMDHKSSDTGKILLPPKIVEIMRYFPTPVVDIDINWDNYRIDISGGSAKFNLYGSDPEDYPVSFDRDLNESEAFTIELSKFKKLMKSVAFAASNEETRPAFNGILLFFNNQNLTLTASDTYRLAVKKAEDASWAFSERKCLVPARAIRELLRILPDQNGALSIYIHSNLLAFQFDQIYFATRLLEEKYPDVSGVIPTVYKTRVTIERKLLEETVGRAALLAEGKNLAVNLFIRNSQLEARVSSQEGSMEEFLPVEQDGEDLELHVNTRFILDIVKILDGQKISIDFHGQGGPLIFRMYEDLSYLYLVLPIKKVN